MDKDNKEERSLAWRVIKGLLITNIITLFLWFATIGGFIWYQSLYDYVDETTTIEQQTDTGGNNSNVINKGELVDGLSEDNNINKEQNKE